MNGSITGGASVITPTLILELTEEAQGGNIVHPILGRSNPDVTLRPGGRRTGTIALGFAGANSEALSATARSVLLTAGLLTLVAPARPSLNGLTFVIPEGGRVQRSIEPDTRNAWTVVLDYQEVTP